MTVITCVEDLRVLAKKRVPRMFYDYADVGSWTESTYRANEADFQKIKVNASFRLPPCFKSLLAFQVQKIFSMLNCSCRFDLCRRSRHHFG